MSGRQKFLLDMSGRENFFARHYPAGSNILLDMSDREFFFLLDIVKYFIGHNIC